MAIERTLQSAERKILADLEFQWKTFHVEGEVKPLSDKETREGWSAAKALHGEC
jgi:hypothetical protein